MLSRAAAEPRRFPRRPAGGVNPVQDDEGCRIYVLVSPQIPFRTVRHRTVVGGAEVLRPPVPRLRGEPAGVHPACRQGLLRPRRDPACLQHHVPLRYLYHVTKTTTAEAKAAEAARAPAAKALRRDIAMSIDVQGANCKLMLRLGRYQDVMRKQFCSHRRPARGLEALSEEGIPDSLLWQYRSQSFDAAVADAQ